MTKRTLTFVVLGYSVIAAAMTWPLLPNVTSKIAGDLIDPLLNSWILSWTAGQALAFLHGNFGALSGYWNGNIFFPDTLTLGYSEHLTGEMLQILPIYAITGNALLCYNILFFSTFVLAGLGIYCFVAEITSSKPAAFVAGLAFSYAPYRLAQEAHLQVLSTFWIAFALFGLRRFFATASWRALIGASSAVLLQNLSSGYYIFFAGLSYAAYCAYELARARLNKWLLLRRLGIAAAAVAVLTAPFIAPYLRLRAEGRAEARSYSEVVAFSADTHSFATAPASSWLWGIHGKRLLAFPKGEGEGFPGFTILGLALSAVIFAAARGRRPWSTETKPSGLIRTYRFLLGLVLAIDLVGICGLLIVGRPARPLRAVLGLRTDAYFGVAILILFVSFITIRPVRQFMRRMITSVTGACLLATVAVALFALGPEIQVAGHTVGTGPYYFLYRWVPGIDGLRVPARFLMLLALFLSVLAGLGLAEVLKRKRLVGWVVAIAASVGILAEGWSGPLPMNVRLWAHGLEQPPRAVFTGKEVSPVYEFLRTTSARVVLIEFPFGEPVFDVRSVFYAGYHRRPLVNGYSGYFPNRYSFQRQTLGYIPTDLKAATDTLRQTGATFALVHEDAFLQRRGHEVSDWLTSIGASLVVASGGDKLFRLP